MTNPEPKMMALFCKGCNDVFMMPSRRGRPPQFCSKCGGDPDTVYKVETEVKLNAAQERLISAKERVDRLEMMLRSTGNHISQYRARLDNQ
jgi:hypothetical protein